MAWAVCEALLCSSALTLCVTHFHELAVRATSRTLHVCTAMRAPRSFPFAPTCAVCLVLLHSNAAPPLRTACSGWRVCIHLCARSAHKPPLISRHTPARARALGTTRQHRRSTTLCRSRQQSTRVTMASTWQKYVGSRTHALHNADTRVQLFARLCASCRCTDSRLK
ncbi:MAG: hypothetical protein EOO65_01260 [Methanosarcinales archaeon]|nr:MAG: hypothetical protein EOO65_01260 [Methanosarcinales archaeon]